MRSTGRAGRENIYETGEEGGMEEGEWRRETKETGDRKRGDGGDGRQEMRY